jgi:hypothetical protein
MVYQLAGQNTCNSDEQVLGEPCPFTSVHPLRQHTRTRCGGHFQRVRSSCTYGNSRSRWSHRARNVKLAPSMVTVWVSTERRCISIRRSPGVVEGDMLKSDKSKSPPSSRLMRASRLRLNTASHAERVIVGGNELGQGLFQIRAEQQRIARLDRLANLAQEVLGRARDRSCRSSCPGNSTTTPSPGLRRATALLKPSRYSVSNPRMLTWAKSSSSRSQLTRAVEDISMGSTSSTYGGRGLPVSGASSGRCRCRVQRPCHAHARCSAMSPECRKNPLLRPRQPILRKLGDRFKQGRADVVVKIL